MNTLKIPGFYEQTIPNRSNAIKIGVLVLLLILGFMMANWIFGSDISIVIKLFLLSGVGILNAIFVIGLGILAHDAVHGALFRHRSLNYLVGGIISAIALLPFRTNRRFHLKHHRYAHQKGLDPENFMHDRPYWQGVLLGVHIGLFIHYFALTTHILRIKSKLTENLGLTGRDVLIDLMISGTTITFFYLMLPYVFNWSLLATSGLTILFIPVVFSWRAMADHYGLPDSSKENLLMANGDADDQDMAALSSNVGRTYRPVSGWIVHTHPFFCWVWSNVNYHEVHHQFPWLSYHYLPKVYEQTKGEIPYAELNGYWHGLLGSASKPYYIE